MDKREKDLKTASFQKAGWRRRRSSIKKKSGVDGKLFGSVTAKDVVEAVKKALDLDIDRRSVRFDEPIKTTGRPYGRGAPRKRRHGPVEA